MSIEQPNIGQLCFITSHQLIVFFQLPLIGECQSLLLGGPRVNVKVKLSSEKMQIQESYEEVTKKVSPVQ